MLILRLCIAYSVFVLFSIFLLANLADDEGGTGYVYLLSSGVMFVTLYLLSNKYTLTLRVKKMFIPLVLFITYLCLMVLFDTLNMTELKKITIGTTNGVVFSLLMGGITSFTLATIYDISTKSKSIFKIACIFGVFYVCFVMFKTLDVFTLKIENIRDDLFLLEETNGAYQRPSAFIFMQFLLTCSLVTVLSILTRSYYTNTLLILMGLCTLVTAVLFMMLSQLIGSNSGFVTVVGFLLVWLTYLLIALPNKNIIYRFNRIGFKNVLFSFVGRNILIYFTSLFACIIILGIFILTITDVNADQIRILGFGSGEVSSVDSRFALIRSNFVEHFSYNPIFGNTQVDTITTGEGTYIHSVLSILTHLGLVGWLLFTWLLVLLYIDIKKIELISTGDDLYENKLYKLFRLFAIPCVFTFAIFSAFFTWMPLWYCIGLLGLSFAKQSKAKQSKEKLRLHIHK